MFCTRTIYRREKRAGAWVPVVTGSSDLCPREITLLEFLMSLGGSADSDSDVPGRVTGLGRTKIRNLSGYRHPIDRKRLSFEEGLVTQIHTGCFLPS